MANVLVFVPGLLGSELYDGDDKVWPGSGWAAIRGLSNVEFERLLKPDLVAKRIIYSAVGGFVNIYQSWIDYFQNMRRLSDNRLMFTEADGTLVTVPYDWRKSCGVASILLADALDRIAIDRGPETQVHIVAHSLGGLVARHYLQSGDYEKRAGFSLAKSFVTFGTPHNGAPIALAGAVGLHKTNFLSTEQSVQLANDARYTSLYETFPQASHPLIWERKSDGHLMPRLLAEKDFALGILRLNEGSYDSYINFRSSIDGKLYPPTVRRFVLMGTRYETVTHFYWTGKSLRTATTKDAGDGTVSIQAAYVADAQCQMTGESHVSLIRSIEARQAFAELMGASVLLGTSQIEISVRDVSIDTGAPIHVSIVTDGQFDRMSGEIVIEGCALPAGTGVAVPDASTFVQLRGRAPQPFSYDGPKITGATLCLPGIGTPGLYRIVVRTAGSGEPVAQSPVFVVSAP